MNPLPSFPYHRDPVASGSIKQSESECQCCGVKSGVIYSGVIYASSSVKNICPWCIADGSAEKKLDACFFDAQFCDEAGEEVIMPASVHREVFFRTIGFSTWNPIGWWVHCGRPAEFVCRREPYDLVFECRSCHKQHVIQDLD
jgi:uncharacterized protein CbrC (UPF0167 family)